MAERFGKGGARGPRSGGPKGGAQRGFGGAKKPFGSKFGDKKPYGERKPYARRAEGAEGAERKPYAPRGDRPYTPRGDKPYGERKPYARRAEGAEGGERKPYAPRGDRPYTPRGDKPYGERKPYARRAEGAEGGERKPYAPRGDRPYTPRGDKPYGARKPYGEKSFGDRKPYGDRKSFGERKPYAPRERDETPRDDQMTGVGKPARFDGRPERARRTRAPEFSDRKPWREQRDQVMRQVAVKDPAGGDGWLVGVHPVLAALKAGRRNIRQIWLLAEPKAELAELLAAHPEWPVSHKTRPEFDAEFGEVAHQGVAALVGNLPQPSLPQVLASKPKLLVALDQVTDPHNVGAIVRSAAAFGASAVIHTEHRAAGLTPVVAKTAAGALEVVPLVEVVNLVQSLNLLQEAGFTVIGLAGEAEHPTLAEAVATFNGPVCLVLGSEGEGLRRLTRETCDHLARLPISNVIESLNVSVAAGVALSMLQKG